MSETNLKELWCICMHLIDYDEPISNAKGTDWGCVLVRKIRPDLTNLHQLSRTEKKEVDKEFRVYVDGIYAKWRAKCRSSIIDYVKYKMENGYTDISLKQFQTYLTLGGKELVGKIFNLTINKPKFSKISAEKVTFKWHVTNNQELIVRLQLARDYCLDMGMEAELVEKIVDSGAVYAALYLYN